MSNKSNDDAALQQKFAKYPSLRRFYEAGDDYVEWNDGREDELLKFLQNHAHLEKMRNDPLRIMAAMDDFAWNKDFLISIGTDKAKAVADILAETKPKIVVELGGYVGYSALLFGYQLRQIHGIDSGVKVWSLEFEPKFAEIMRQVISMAGLSNVVNVVVGPAAESLRKLAASGDLKKIDLLFLDHVEDLYEQDFKIAMDDLKLLDPGATIVADNVVRPGAPHYRKYIRDRADLASKGVRGLIMPGEYEDELEVTKVL